MPIDSQIIILQRKWRKWRLRPPPLIRSSNNLLDGIDSPLKLSIPINYWTYHQQTLGFLDNNNFKHRYPSNNFLTIPTLKRSFSSPLS